MNDVIDSLFVALGFKVDDSGLEDLKKKTEELKSHVKTLGAIFTGAALGIGLLVEHVASGMGDLYSFAELNNMTARSVAALGKVATDNDGSLDGMKSTIQSLNSTIGQAALGIGRGAMTFKKLGIEAKDSKGRIKTVDVILEELSDRMVHMSRQEQIALADKLGIDPQFVKVMEQGSAKLRELREEAESFNPMTEEQYKLADEVDKLFIKAKASVGILTKMIGASLLPIMKQVLTTYMAWYKEARNATSGVVIDGLKALVAVIGTAWDWIVRLVTAGRRLYDWMKQFTVVTYAAAFALGVFASVKTYNTLVDIGAALRKMVFSMVEFNAVALVIPAIIGAIAIAIGLLIDDFVTWKEGGDSVIGGLVEKFPQLGQILDSIYDAFMAIGDFLIGLWDQAKGPLSDLLGAFVNLFQTVWPLLKMIITGWAMLISVVLPLVVSFIATVMQGWANLITFLVTLTGIFVDIIAGTINVIVLVFHKVVDTISGIWSNFINFFLMQFELVKAAVSWIANKLGFGDSSINANITQAPGAGAASGGAGSSGSNGGAGAAMSGASAMGSVVDSSKRSTVDQSTNINGGLTIQVVSPDPDKAGDAVKDKMGQLNRQQTRSAAGAVKI